MVKKICSKRNLPLRNRLSFFLPNRRTPADSSQESPLQESDDFWKRNPTKSYTDPDVPIETILVRSFGEDEAVEAVKDMEIKGIKRTASVYYELACCIHFSMQRVERHKFGDIYEEDYFINYLKPDIQIVRELPKDLQSLDLEAVGSVVTDGDIMKEAKPSFYLKHILPILLRNRVVHLIGFGNRLASDPIPFQLQRLRCRCNFHALRFVPKIQESGALLIQRMRRNVSKLGPLDEKLIGSFAKSDRGQSGHSAKDSKYLALHLRYEIDMVAHSLCDFGGGKEEQEELEAYRAMHFPALVELEKTKKLPSPATLRAEGLCPLMSLMIFSSLAMIFFMLLLNSENRPTMINK